MKKILLSILAFGTVVSSFGQHDQKKRPSLGVHFFLDDFQSAVDVKANGLSNLIQSKQWHKTSRMNAGIAFSYLQGLGNNLDFAGTLSASFLNYPVPGQPAFITNNPLLEAAATVNLKLMTDKNCFVPFLTAGAGASKYKGYYGAFAPIGVGLQLKIFDEAFVMINSQYRIPVTENVAYHFYHSIGIVGNMYKKKEAPAVVLPPPPPPEPPKDRDGDGVLDDDDRCPDAAGPASLRGCPDKDGDGIVDIDDKCPDVAGLARYQGCPIPDRDKDGINDELDKCPDVSGYARYQGCPIPDTDKDGVNDEEDKCVNEPGPASNFGCPVIPEAIVQKVNLAAGRIYFATGSAKLLAKSFPPLKEVAQIMKDNPTYKINIEGHTDSTGGRDMNMKLSNDRAASVSEYLKSVGVNESHMSSEGFGPDRPIAPNKTTAGRAKNRRVEMRLRNY